MPASVNINLISPSCVGDYAGCPMKLVNDTDYPPPRDPNPWADFGTLAHFDAMYMMGLNPPPVKDFELIVSSAASLYGHKDEKLSAAVEAAAKRAIAAVPKLPTGVRWVCEVRKHDETLLPERVSRSGERGYGGVVDLFASDKSILVDFKFVGKPPDKVKLAYLWQMASYHLVTGVPKCMLLFTTRDSKIVCTCTLDFSLPLWANFAQRVRCAISAMGHADFRRNAFFNEGDQCGFCQQKTRCPLMAKPSIVENMNCAVPTKTDDFMTSMLAISEAEKLMATSKPAAAKPAAPTPSAPSTDLF